MAEKLVYNPTIWINDTTAINADRLNNIESGISAVTEAVNDISGYIVTPVYYGVFNDAGSLPVVDIDDGSTADVISTDFSVNERYVYADGEWVLDSKSGLNEIASVVGDTIEAVENIDSSVYQDRIGVTTSDGTIIAKLNGNTGTFYVDNVVCKELTTDTIVNEDGENVLKAITDEVDAKLAEISSADLSKWTMYTIGDSLSTGGVWQQEIVDKTHINWDSSLNAPSDYAKRLSFGGTNTYGGFYCGVWRTRFLVKESGYIQNEGKNTVIIFENINDAGQTLDIPNCTYNSKNPDWIATITGELTSEELQKIYNDEPDSTVEIDETVSINTSNCIKALTTTTYACRISFTEGETYTDGNFKVVVAGNNTSKTVTIAVNSTDTPSDLIAKIVEYDYSDVQGVYCYEEDGYAVFGGSDIYFGVTLSAGTIAVPSYVLEDNGVTAWRYQMYIYNGTDTDEDNYTNTSNWKTQFNFTQAWMSCIEMVQANYPYAKILLANFPRYSVSSLDSYKRDDGSYDIVSYHENDYSGGTAKNDLIQSNFEQLQEYYHVDVLNMRIVDGISAPNFTEFYQESNVHYLTKGYKRAGDLIAVKLLDICLSEGEQD